MDGDGVSRPSGGYCPCHSRKAKLETNESVSQQHASYSTLAILVIYTVQCPAASAIRLSLEVKTSPRDHFSFPLHPPRPLIIIIRAPVPARHHHARQHGRETILGDAILVTPRWFMLAGLPGSHWSHGRPTLGDAERQMISQQQKANT